MSGIMREVVKLLGVKIGEPFEVIFNDSRANGTFYIDNEGYLQAITTVGIKESIEAILEGLLQGRYEAKPVENTSDLDNYRLCYVEDSLMYFTDDFENVHGDDWDDRPYQNNAGTPYAEYVRRIIAFEDRWDIEKPSDGRCYYSAYDINRGAAAWLFHEKAGGLMGGASYADAVIWLRKAGIRWGELHW